VLWVWPTFLFLGWERERKRRERGDSWPKVHNLWVSFVQLDPHPKYKQ
jgi:hypothetical protein